MSATDSFKESLNTTASWFPNGKWKARYRSELVNENKHIVYEEWDDEGRPTLRAENVNGTSHGVTEGWYEKSTQLCVRSHWKNDTKHGPYERWHKNGQLQHCAQFVDGKMHGAILWFGDTGRTIEENYHRHGVLLDADQYWVLIRGLGNVLAEVMPLPEKALGSIIAQYADFPPDFPPQL